MSAKFVAAIFLCSVLRSIASCGPSLLFADDLSTAQTGSIWIEDSSLLKADAYYPDETALEQADEDRHSVADPQDIVGHLDRGRVRLKQMKFDDAVADFTKVIEMNPDHADAYYYRALASQNVPTRMNRLDDLERAIALNPSHAGAYAERGRILLEIPTKNKSTISRAIKDLSAALKIDPQNQVALTWRAVAYGAMGRLDDSIADLRKLLELIPREWDRLPTLLALSEAYRLKRDFKNAWRYLEEAERITGKDYFLTVAHRREQLEELNREYPRSKYRKKYLR